ncbi:MFS transporter [Thalassobacillus hwangdonensis]|uniref:MFS transporter n=1 Tax=Thalassobacillus hwangdonensis TaxID=546108 RepID=A0ABW3L1G2_9BACI
MNQTPHFKVILILSTAVWLVVMNTTMFNIALPDILQDFSITPSQGAWIVSGYSIVLAIFTITYTRLSDYMPIRTLLIIGISIFGLSSILGFFADSFLTLLFARLLQATGSAAIPGLSFVYAGRYIPFERRGRSMALIASASSLGFGLGPVVGGGITDYLDWNYLFIVTLMVVLVIPLLLKIMPGEEIRKGRFDVLGAILTGVTITSFLLFISTFTWYYLTAGILTGFLLWLRLNRSDVPFIQPDLLRNKYFRRVLFISFLGFATHFAILFLMPIMLQQVFDKGASAIGLIIFPGAMVSAIAAVFVGRLIDRYGNMKVLAMAHGLLIISTLIFYFLSPINEYMIMIAYMFTSFGFSSLSTSTTNEVSRILPEEQIGSGIGMKQQTHFIGSASGSVLAGILLEINEAPYQAGAFAIPFGALIGLMGLSFLLFLYYWRFAPAGIEGK